MRTYIRKKLLVQEIEDVQSLCRLCLGKAEEMISIFDADASNVIDVLSGLPLKITSCLGLEVSPEDTFPKFICQTCHSELNKFYAFKKSCASTYRKLIANLISARINGRRNVNDETNHSKTPNKLVLDSIEKCDENITVDPLQSVEKNELLIELSRHNSPDEENSGEVNVMLNENNDNCIVTTDLKTEEEDWHMTIVSDETTGHPSQSLPTADIEQVHINDNTQHDVNDVLDAVQEPQDEKTENSDNATNVECLPSFLVRTLIEKGVLAKRDDRLEILDQSIKTFNLETDCGSEIVLELVEEDMQVAAKGCSKSPQPKIFDPDLKSDARWCGTCGVRFSSRGALVRHARVHSGERPFPCRTCGRRFAQREVLRRHELLHSDKLPYQCAWCPKAYTQRGALDAHTRSHAPPDARPLVLHRCSRCPKVFLYPSGLSRHMSVHQGRDFPCDECPRTFNDKSSLQRHRRVHQRLRAR